MVETMRFRMARWLIHAGLKVMPPGRYRTELNAALWTLNLRVASVVAADRASKMAEGALEKGS